MRYERQERSIAQKSQARENIGAASLEDHDYLENDFIGHVDDFTRHITAAERAAWNAGPAAIPRVEISDPAATLEPNRLYVFPEMAALTITLAAPEEPAIANEYRFRFTSGAWATALTLPNTIRTPKGFGVEANAIYDIRILEGCLTAQSWAVGA